MPIPASPQFRFGLRALGGAIAAGLLVSPACSRREEPASPAPASPPPALPSNATPTPSRVLDWSDPQSDLVLRWRGTQKDAALLADLFAFPAAGASMFTATQQRIEDTQRVLEGPVPELQGLSFRAASGGRSVFVMRTNFATHAALQAHLATSGYPLQQHHEWSCVQLPRSFAQDLCLMDAPDFVWLDRNSIGLDLVQLRQARDLNDSPQRRSVREAWEQSPTPFAILQGFIPMLHLELDEDPIAFDWSIKPFGRDNTKGNVGWGAQMHMRVQDPQAAVDQLKAAAGLADEPRASALRRRAHVGVDPDKRVEIRLELHGDDPRSP